MLNEQELPKGMVPRPSSPAEIKATVPPPLTLGSGNYAAAIRQALTILPVEVRVDRFLVLEQDGRPPQVRLTLTILGEKEGYSDQRDSQL